jgi:hypothetical protein
VLDISDPARPRLIGSFDPEPMGDESMMPTKYRLSSLAVNGDFVIAADTYYTKILAFEVSDPYSPALVGEYSIRPAFPRGIALEGSHAFVAAQSSGLLSFDLSDIAHPRLAGSANLTTDPRGIEVDGSTAFIADADGFFTVDLSAPARPVLKSARDGEYKDISLNGNVAFLSSYEGIDVYDVSLPSQPALLHSRDESGNVCIENLAARGNYLYVSEWYWGLDIFSVSTPSHPRKLSTYACADTKHVCVQPPYAYLSVFPNELRVVNISNPYLPLLAGRTYLGEGNYSHIESVFLDGSLAYACSWSGLHIMDISSPAKPSQIGFYGGQYGNTTYKRAITRLPYAYCLTSSSLAILDVSDPSQVRGMLSIPIDYCSDLAFMGDTRVVVCANNGLTIIDVSDPGDPVQNSKSVP